MNKKAPMRKCARLILTNILVLYLLLFLIDVALSYSKKTIPNFCYPPNLQDSIVNLEFKTSFKTNELGIRHTNLISNKFNGERKNILVIGDSYVFGLGVEQDKTFCSLLNKKFEHLRFINSGIINTGPYQHQNIIKSITSNYQIQGILYCSFANDIGDTPTKFPAKVDLINNWKKLFNFFFPNIYSHLREVIKNIGNHQNEEKNQFFNKKQRKKEYGKKLVNLLNSDSISQEGKTILTDSLLTQIAYDGLASWTLSLGYDKPNYLMANLELEGKNMLLRWKNAKEILSNIHQFCLEKDIELAACYFPAPSQYDPYWNSNQKNAAPINYLGMKIKDSWLIDTTKLQVEISEFWKKKNIDFIDTTPLFRGFSNNFFTYKIDLHWNNKGQEHAAKIIKNWIKEKEIFYNNECK